MDHLLTAPAVARALLVLAHGAGAGMRHAFLERAAQAFAQHGIATYRYEFPYMQAKKSRPDSPAVAGAAAREAVTAAGRRGVEIPLIHGGRMVGVGRRAQAQCEERPPGRGGLGFPGVPAQPPRRP